MLVVLQYAIPGDDPTAKRIKPLGKMIPNIVLLSGQGFLPTHYLSYLISVTFCRKLRTVKRFGIPGEDLTANMLKLIGKQIKDIVIESGFLSSSHSHFDFFKNI